MKNKRKNSILTIILVALTIILIIGLVFVQEKQVEVQYHNDNDYHYVEHNGKSYTYNSSIVSLLFMGIDTSDPDQLGQADTMNLVLLDRDHESIKILSLSRDTMTDIHLYDVEHNSLGWDKQHLGLAYAYGDSPMNGAMLTSDAVSKLLMDVPIVHYAAMNLSDLGKIHDIVGQLEVEIPNDSLVHVNPSWTKGSIAVLTKDNVESFLRTRDTNENFSNEERIERQKAYLNAYMTKIKGMFSKNFDNTVSLMYNVVKSLTSNITFENVESFAKMLLSYSYNPDKDFYTLPGENTLGSLHDEFIVNENECKELILELFYKEGK